MGSEAREQRMLIILTLGTVKRCVFIFLPLQGWRH